MKQLFALSGALALLCLNGCIAKTVVDVATLPVKAASKTVDLATTSQSEADEKRGRALREREERLGKLSRQRDKAVARCADGDDDACDTAEKLDERIAEEQEQPL